MYFWGCFRNSKIGTRIFNIDAQSKCFISSLHVLLYHIYIILLLVLLEINELFNVWHVQMFQRLIVMMKISHYVLCNVQIFVTRSLSILPLQYTGHWTPATTIPRSGEAEARLPHDSYSQLFPAPGLSCRSACHTYHTEISPLNIYYPYNMPCIYTSAQKA